jgi:hypothetical protein
MVGTEALRKDLELWPHAIVYVRDDKFRDLQLKTIKNKRCQRKIK